MCAPLTESPTSKVNSQSNLPGNETKKPNKKKKGKGTKHLLNYTSLFLYFKSSFIVSTASNNNDENKLAAVTSPSTLKRPVAPANLSKNKQSKVSRPTSSSSSSSFLSGSDGYTMESATEEYSFTSNYEPSLSLSSPRDVFVTVADFSFIPERIIVKVGSTVTWIVDASDKTGS